MSNRKEARRKGKIQLIDATAMKSPLRRNMGKKNCAFTPEIRQEILRLFLEMEESDISRIFPNEEFGYWSITVERPLRLRVHPAREIPAAIFRREEEHTAILEAVTRAAKEVPLDDWTKFAQATQLKAAALKKLRPILTEKDEAAQPVIGEPDTALRDSEFVPLCYAGGIAAFMQDEVLPYAPDAWVDEAKTTIGYEISFAKYFYKPAPMRELDDIIASLNDLEKTTDNILKDILEELR